MRLEKFDIKKLEKENVYHYCAAQKLVKEFIDSDMECAIVKDFNHKNANVCANTLKKAAKTLKIKGITIISRKGNVYLWKG